MSRAACIPETLGDRGGGVRALGDGVTPVSETHTFLLRMETFSYTHTHSIRLVQQPHTHTHGWSSYACGGGWGSLKNRSGRRWIGAEEKMAREGGDLPAHRCFLPGFP